MYTYRSRNFNDSDIDDGLSSIHNYYEKLVFEAVMKHPDIDKVDENTLADIACVTLNRLPPRYIRFNVDMTFFTSPQELQEMFDKIEALVKESWDFVLSNRRDRD